MLVSPSFPCSKCQGIVYYLRDDGRVCINCHHFEAEMSLEEQVPGITAKIIKARSEEERGEEGED